MLLSWFCRFAIRQHWHDHYHLKHFETSQSEIYLFQNRSFLDSCSRQHGLPLRMLRDVDALSDDGAELEQLVPATEAQPLQVVPSGSRKKKSQKSSLALVGIDSALKQKLRHIVQGKCFCSNWCFTPLQEDDAFKQLFQLRKTLRGMNKADADQKAWSIEWRKETLFSIVQQYQELVIFLWLHPGRSTTSWTTEILQLLGPLIRPPGTFCSITPFAFVGSANYLVWDRTAVSSFERLEFQELHGRLREAGLPHKYGKGAQSHKREKIHDFLMECYIKHAEPMPEVHTNPGTRQQTDRPARFRVRKGKRPRRFFKRDEKLDGEAAQNLRLLPPGSYSDYHRPLCQVSLKLFTRATLTCHSKPFCCICFVWRFILKLILLQSLIAFEIIWQNVNQVWEEGFRTKLQIRPVSSHSKCATCTRHKLVLRRLSEDTEARKAQTATWATHMERQFADRRVYWDSRSMSRLGQTPSGDKTLTIIVDSMDHSKWSIPRSAILSDKTFSNFVRPHMDCTGLICHGHMVMIAFAEPHIIKGANWTVELLMYALRRLTESGLDLRQYEVILQSDNATRECKNNSCLRALSYLTSRGSVRCARVSYLASGHSHEDIDQFFSLLGSFLSHDGGEMHTPSEFMSKLRQYLGNPSVRPLEKLREVVKIDQLREWHLELQPLTYQQSTVSSKDSKALKIQVFRNRWGWLTVCLEAEGDLVARAMPIEFSEGLGRPRCATQLSPRPLELPFRFLGPSFSLFSKKVAIAKNCRVTFWMIQVDP